MTVDLLPWAADVPDATVAAIRASRRLVTLSHEHPDADTLGAALALAAMVEAAGGEARALCADAPPPLYAFMPGIERFERELDPDFTPDLLVLVDCGTSERIGPLAERHADLLAATPTIVIDHHASNAAGGPADWVDPGAAATCEMVALLGARLGRSLAGNPDVAANLMAGIVMDTATFAHPNATPRTLAAAAALVAAGAPLADISRRLYRTKPDAQLRLFGRVLDRIETASGGAIIHAALLRDDLAATGAIPAHSEGIIDLLAQSESAAIAILFKETDDGATRVSVRTRPGGVDATELTGAFGGGGHARAAGATVALPLASARDAVLLVAARLARGTGA